MRNGRIKFCYDNTWTSWYSMDNIPKLEGIKIQSVIIEEEMTEAEAGEYIREFHDMSFKEF